MKSALLYLLTVGLASSSLLFSPGNEYVYTYSGKILTGIPQIDTTFAGLSITGQVIVQATGTNTFKIAMKDVGISTFNDKLVGVEPLNWRTVATPPTNPLTDLYRKHMESPVEVTLENGKISMVKISAEEPQWAVNFKKALVSTLKIQLPAEGSPIFWTVMEEGIEGICENTYQASELPEYLVHEVEQGTIKPEHCQGKKYFEVMKARDITKCMDRSLFLSSKSHAKCLLGNCDEVSTKSSTTRYFGCGETVETIQLHGIINEGELLQNVLAFNTEQVVTGTKQILKLVTVQPITTDVPEIEAPKTLLDILYEFPKPINNHIKSHEEQKEYYQLTTMDPSNQLFLPEGSLEEINKKDLKVKVIEKLKKIATQLAEVENFGEKEIPSELKSLKTVLCVLSTEELKEVYTSIMALTVPFELKETMRSLLLDTIRQAGTSPSIMFQKEMIETEELTDVEALLAIAVLANNIKTPTVALIDQIFELIKSPAVTKKPLLKAHAYLVFATLVRKSCLTLPVTEVYPEYVFGKLCSPDNEKITKIYIPHLVNELKSARDVYAQMGAILVVGAVGHESIIPLILQHIEGKVAGITPAVRALAIYSLADETNKYRNILLPVFASLVHNPAEARAIRIAAFSMLMKMQPDTVHLQRLAVSTWFEKDAEMHKFIYSSLKALAQLDLENHPEGSHWKDLTLKAQGVLPLAKPVPGIITSTFSSYISGVLRPLGIGYQMLTALVTGSTNQHLYHRTEYFLKQVHTVPIEFAVHVGGIKEMARELVKNISGDNTSYLEQIHPQLKEIIEALKVSPVEETPLDASLWARLDDDTQFVYAANLDTVDFIKEQVMESLKAPGKLLEKICKKTPINFNKALEFLPYQAMIPSDLGLPIVTETQATYLVSLLGEIDVDCAASSVALKLAKKAAFTYSGYVGTVSPFTNELLVAGINEHRATNIPVKAVVEVAPKEHSLKIVMKQIDEITPSMTSIDMHHYQVTPFTARKPLIFIDLTPIVLHKDTKVLKSVAKLKTYEVTAGENIGLDMKIKVDTESDLYDLKTMMDGMALYKYNPVLATLFHFTETALKADGLPTARFHKYSLILNPAKSVTKEAEVTVLLNIAEKKMGEEAHLIKLIGSKIEKIALSTSTGHESKLHESIRKLQSEYAHAVNMWVTAKLIGGKPLTYQYSATAGKGAINMEHKWNLHLETVDGPIPMVETIEGVEPVKMVCVEGGMTYPIVPSAGIKWKYFNNIGFGETCQEFAVRVDGTTAVSNKQKQYSKISPEARLCDKLTIEAQKLQKQIKYVIGVPQDSKLHQKYALISAKRVDVCNMKENQAFVFDQAIIEVTTSETLPTFVYTFGRLTHAGLKVLLYPYQVALPGLPVVPTNKIQVKLNFNQKLNAVTMHMETPMDTVVYKNVRLPVLVEKIVPLIAKKSPMEQSYEALTGSPLYGKCLVGQGFVQTYDKKTYGYQLDTCDHIITSDCSKEYSHAVIAKEITGQKHISVYYKKSKFSLIPSLATYKLEVDGQEISVIKNKMMYIPAKDLMSIFSIYWSADNIIVLETPVTRVTLYNGKDVKVEDKTLLADGSRCGLCGDYNQHLIADVKSPKGCVYSSPYTSALSYRVKTGACELSQEQQQLISAEETKCVKYHTEKTPVSSLYKSLQQTTQPIKKHSTIYQGDKLCISQEPVVQCVSGSLPKAVTHKTIKFVCLPEGRVSKLYAERIERGESPQELKQQPVSFETKMAQPISCGISQL